MPSARPGPIERFIMNQRKEMSDAEILLSFNTVRDKLLMRLKQKHRGSFIGPHETFGIIAEEYDELLEALRADNVRDFHDELVDIAVAAILGITSLAVNAVE